MTEDELYTGITEALTFAGWRWIHMLRSDGVVTGTGAAGWPDLFAVHPIRCHVIAWELKGDRGVVSQDQWAWIGPLAVAAVKLGVGRYPDNGAQFDARIVGPADYDAALAYIVGSSDRMPSS